MLHLEVLVPDSRDAAALVTLNDGMKRVREDIGVASVAQKIAARQGNPSCDPLRPGGHAPFGYYLLLRHARPPEGCEVEYGTDILLFEPQSGPALEAESFGRLALLVYAGPAGADARLRCTQGGVRVSKAMINEIAARLGPDGDVDLRIAPLKATPWWQFWKPKHSVNAAPLSSDLPHLVAPPQDEMSLMSALLQGTRTRRRSRSETEQDGDRSSYSDSGSSRVSDTAPFRGGGGEYAGGGASGSWGGGAGNAARRTGVDDSGRILGAGAAAGVAAAVVAEAASGRADAGGETSSEAGEGGDTGTRTDTAY